MKKLLPLGLAAAAVCTALSGGAVVKGGLLQPTTVTKAGTATTISTHKTIKNSHAVKGLKHASSERSFGGAVQSDFQRISRMRKAPARPVKVTFDLPAEDKGYFGQAIGLTGTDGTQYWAQMDEQGTIFAQVPKDTYVVVGFFAMVDIEAGPNDWGEYRQTGNAMVVKEGVDVASPFTFSLDGSEAKNFITASAIAPDGEAYTLPKQYIVANENGYPDFGDSEDGTAYGITLRMGLQHKTLGELFWSQVGCGEQWVSVEFPEYDEPSYQEQAGVYFNDFGSDIIVIGSCAVSLTEGADALTVAMQDGSAPAMLTNSASDYTSVATKLIQSELGAAQPFPAIEQPWSINAYHYLNGVKTDALGLDGAPDLSLFNFCATATAAEDFAAGTQAIFGDYTTSFECDTTDLGDGWISVSTWRTFNNTVCPEVYIKNGDQLILNTTYDSFYKMKSAPAAVAAMVPELMKYTEAQQLQPYNSTPGFVPLAVCSSFSDGNADLVPFFISPTGYAGETIASVSATIDSNPQITYNGEPVDYDTEYYSDFWSGHFYGWCYDWNDEGHAPGKYTFSFAGPTKVAGIDGCLKLDLAFDQTKADCVPPTVQYVQFRDKDGNLTCELTEETCGTLLIAAGDFDSNADGTLASYAGEGNLKVSYSPNGTYHWTPIVLEKAAEAEGCFAPVYKAALDQIAATSANGWFDLLIEMEDASGNTMGQEISPAFKLTEGTGVAAIAAESASLRMAGKSAVSTVSGIEAYNMVGQKVAATSGKVLDLSGLAPGIYTVRSGKSSVKTIVR